MWVAKWFRRNSPNTTEIRPRKTAENEWAITGQITTAHEVTNPGRHANE